MCRFCSGLKWIIFTVLVYVCSLSYGQDAVLKPRQIEAKKPRFKTLEVRAHTGGHLYTGQSLASELESGYGAFEIRLAWQGRGEDHWSGQLAYPSYGVGFYSGFIGDPKVFGNPNALFGFLNFPVSRASKRNVFAIEPAVGLTYNLEPFDSETNPINDAIGARFAVYFNVNFGWAYKWTRQMDITYGVDFTHFSNGRSYTPNYGLNMFGVNLGLRYHYNTANNRGLKDFNGVNRFASRFDRPNRIKNKPVAQNNGINIYTALGTVQTDEGAGTNVRYTAFSGVLDYQYRFNQVHGVTAGLDYFFDGSLEERFPNDPSRRHLLGIHGGYDFMFWRFGLMMHVGTYISSNQGKSPLYSRIAVRYDINDWLFTQMGLKTEQAIADWVEFGVGFRPFRW